MNSPPEGDPARSSEPQNASRLEWMREQAARIYPLVDDLSTGLGRLLLLLLVSALGITLWLYLNRGLSLPWAVFSGGLLLLPALVLARFWFALSALKSFPGTLAENVGEFAAENLSAAPKRKASFNVIGQARRLWELKGLLGDSGELVRDGLSIGVLLNPFSLLMGVISLLLAGLVLLLALVVLLLVIF